MGGPWIRTDFCKDSMILSDDWVGEGGSGGFSGHRGMRSGRRKLRSQTCLIKFNITFLFSLTKFDVRFRSLFETELAQASQRSN